MHGQEVLRLYITGRARRILRILLQAEQQVTINHLAKKFAVSERTIHRDLKVVEEVLVKHQLKLNRRPGKGLQVTGPANNRENLGLILQRVKYTDYTPEERRAFVLLTLLEMNDPIKLFSLADELQVTEATISNDLDTLEQTLEKFLLTLHRRQGYGVKIEGNEAKKRAAISYLFSEHVDEFSFISLIKENIRNKPQRDIKTISSRLLDLVHPEKLKIIEQEVEKIKKTFPYELADSAYIGLVVHLALAIERLQQGDYIHFDAEQLEKMKNTNEYVVAAKLMKGLENALAMTIPPDEIGYITMHLLGAKLRVDHDYLIEDSNLDIAHKAKKLIAYVSDHLNRELTPNTQLLNDLTAHLKPAVYRIKQKMGIKNPMTAEIRQDYPELFHLLQAGVQETFPKMAFPDEEISFLVLHFASTLLQFESHIRLSALVICSSGIGTAKMLATKLQQQIPEIKDIYNKSLFELQQEDFDAYDLIVSTVPLKGVGEDYIITSPMLERKDIVKIEKAVRHKKITQPLKKKEQAQQKPQQIQEQTTKSISKKLRSINHYTQAILQVLDGFYIQQVKKGNNVKSVLHEICQTLTGENILEAYEVILKKLIEREKIGGLGISGTSLALFHTRSSQAKELHFSIYTLASPLQLEGMDGHMMKSSRVLLMLAPVDARQESLEVLSRISSLIIQNEANMKLFESGNEKEIKLFLAGQFDEWMSRRFTK